LRRRASRIRSETGSSAGCSGRDGPGDFVGIDVAGHRHDEVRCPDQSLVVGARVLCPKSLDARSPTEQGQPIGMHRELGLGKEHERSLGELVLAPVDGGERLALLALDVLVAKARPQQDLREEVERGRQIVARDLEGQPHAAAAREAADVRRQVFDRARKGLGRMALGAARPERRDEVRETRGRVVLRQ
jgi:hypothetical protein